LLKVDPVIFGEPAPFDCAKDAAVALIPYIERQLASGVRLHAVTRHLLGLFRAVPGARAFRRHLATEAVKPGAGSTVLADALVFVLDRDTELAHIAA
jgi:tRNA-dihydrouridine synthase A